MSAKHEVEKAQMRKWVVTSILDSEHNYVNMLDVLLQVGMFANYNFRVRSISHVTSRCALFNLKLHFFLSKASQFFSSVGGLNYFP